MLKSVFIYSCAHPLALDYINDDCEKLKYIAPMPQSVESFGWSDDDNIFVHSANPFYLMRYRTDKKIIPSSAVEDACKEKAGDLSQLSHSEKKQLKDDVLMTLKPQALCRRQDVPVVWHHGLSQLWVGASSVVKADAVMEWVIQTWPGIKAMPWFDRSLLGEVLTQALKDQSWPKGVMPGQKVVLVDPRDTKKKVTVQGVEVDSDAVMHWLSQGFMVQQIQLIWQDKVQWQFSDSGVWSGIKDMSFAESLHEQENEPMTREWLQCALVEELVEGWSSWLEERRLCQVSSEVS